MISPLHRATGAIGAPLLGVLSLLALCGSACGPEPRRQTTNGGLYDVEWRPVPDPIPVAELFALDVTARAKTGAGADALSLVVVMPAHDHGMQTKHEVQPLGGGRFRVTGMKLHMRGTWELHFRPRGPAGEDLVTFTEELR